MNLEWNKTRLKWATNKTISQTFDNENAQSLTDTLKKKIQNLIFVVRNLAEVSQNDALAMNNLTFIYVSMLGRSGKKSDSNSQA